MEKTENEQKEKETLTNPSNNNEQKENQLENQNQEIINIEPPTEHKEMTAQEKQEAEEIIDESMDSCDLDELEPPPEIEEEYIETPKVTFLTTYQELQEEVTDADPQFKEVAGIVLLSLFAEHFRIAENTVISFDKTKPTVGKQLNLWAITYGRSRRTRKSTVIGIVEGILDWFENKYGIPLNLGQEVTPQALIGLGTLLVDDKKTSKNKTKKTKKLSTEEPPKEKIVRPKKLIWLHDEAGGIIAELGNDKGYMRGFDSVASRLYDGRSYTRITKMHGFEKIDAPYFVTLLGGTETIPECFKEESFKQGFYNRPIYYHIKDAEERPKTTRISKEGEARKQIIIQYLEALYQIEDTISIIFKETLFESIPKKMISTFKNKKLDEAEAKLNGSESDRDRLRFGYYGNLENVLERLSALYAIDRCVSLDRITNLYLKGNEAPVYIIEEDVEKAINFVERIMLTGIEDVLKIMEGGDIKIVPREVHKKTFELIISFLKDAVPFENHIDKYDCALTYNELSKKVGMAWNRFGDIMKTMEDNGDIIIHENIPMFIGRPTRLVQLASAVRIIIPQQQSAEEAEALKQLMEGGIASNSNDNSPPPDDEEEK